MKKVLSNVSNTQKQNVSSLNFNCKIELYNFELKVSVKKANYQLLDYLELFQISVFNFCKKRQTSKNFEDLLYFAIRLKQECNKLVCDFWEANFSRIVYLVNKIDPMLLNDNAKYWFCEVKKSIMVLKIKKGVR